MRTNDEAHTASTSRMSDADVLELAAELVEAFIALLEQDNPGRDILDANCLPARRESLEAAFRLVIMTEPRRDTRRRLIEAGTRLAQFQNGVGERIVIIPVTSAPGRAGEDCDISRRLALLFAMAETDSERVRALLVTADQNATRRYSAATPARPDADDGIYTWYGHHSVH